MARILVVDDEPDIGSIVTHALEPEGYDVEWVDGGSEALVILATRPPDVLILDVMMPGLDGFEVLGRISQRNLAAETRIVVMTCRTAERDHLRGWELGADEYLTKPFEAEELTERVRAVLRSTPDELAARRADELAKAVLLDRLEAAMRRPSRPAAAPA